MLLGNYAHQNRNTVREIGIAFSNPHAWFKAAHILSFYTPDTAQAGRDLAAFPYGYNTESAWHLPLKTGGIGAHGVGGTGTISGGGQLGLNGQAAMTGSGGISDAIGLLVAAISAALSGSGGVSAASVQAFLNAVANLSGSGNITNAQASGIGALLAALAGSGVATGTETAIGALSSNITVTGTGLSTANVGQAVWSAIIEAGFTAEQILRIIASHAAGNATDLEGAAPAFEGLDGTTTRIAATYAAGTRTITGLNGD